MPFNVTAGSTVEFTVGFLDQNGHATVPPSAVLTMSYTAWGGTAVSSSVDMTPAGGFFTAIWASGPAAFGDAGFSISAPGQPTPTTGLLRLLE